MVQGSSASQRTCIYAKCDPSKSGRDSLQYIQSCGGRFLPCTRCTGSRYSHKFHTCLYIPDKGYLESRLSRWGTPHSICSRQGRISFSGCLDLCSHTVDKHLLRSKYSKEIHRQDIVVSQCPHKFLLGTQRSIEESLGQREVPND